METIGCQFQKHNKMKAKDFNGQISTYRRLPNVWEDENGVHLNFRKADHKSFGFYDVVKPSYDSISQRLGSIEFDAENEVFTYPVIDIDFDATYEVQTPIVDEDGEAVLDSDGEPTYNVTTESTYKIDELKSSIKTQIKTKAGELLKPTDWYVIRFTERQVAVPDSIAEEREDIVTKAEGFEAELDALESVESVLRYSFEFYPQPDPLV